MYNEYILKIVINVFVVWWMGETMLVKLDVQLPYRGVFRIIRSFSELN